RGYAETQEPITGLTIMRPLAIAQTKSGKAMIPFALDYGVWTANADRLSKQLKTTYRAPGFNTRFEFWVTGNLSPKAKQELEGRGFVGQGQGGSLFAKVDQAPQPPAPARCAPARFAWRGRRRGSVRGTVHHDGDVSFLRPHRAGRPSGPVFAEPDEREAVEGDAVLDHEPAHHLLAPPAQGHIGSRGPHVVGEADHVDRVGGVVLDELRGGLQGFLGLAGQLGTPRLERHAEFLHGDASVAIRQGLADSRVHRLALSGRTVRTLSRVGPDLHGLG